MNKNIKKYKWSLLTILCLMVLSSSAFFINKMRTDNVITFGNIKIQLINHTLDEHGNEIEVKDEEEILRNEDVSRIIKAKNVCNYPAYVRIKLNMLGQDDTEFFQAEDYVKYNFADNKWQEKDGWFYYTSILEPNKTTEDLMRGIQFDIDKLTADHAGSDISFKIHLQAVQSKNNADDIFEVKGWPEEVIE